MKKLIVTILLLGSIGLLFNIVQAQDARIYGIVTYSGQPVSGIGVQVRDTISNKLLGILPGSFTGEDGRFDFTVPQGSYRIQFTPSISSDSPPFYAPKFFPSGVTPNEESSYCSLPKYPIRL